MSDDDDDGWGECDAVISCELFAVELIDPDGVGILAELITDEGAYRIVWRRNQAVDLLDQLVDGIAILDNRTDD